MNYVISAFYVINIFLLVPEMCIAQDYTYTNYDIKDGLAGSTVYCTEQDKEGFLWFGTETGLSRFDGTHFKNFTTADGLSDNEILKMFCDSKDRLWLLPFRKSLCYIQKGIIHNNQNDTLLSKIHLTGLAWQICEDAHGNILIRENKTLHLVTASNKVIDISVANNKPLEYCWGISRSGSGNFWVLDKNNLFEINSSDSNSRNNFFSFSRQTDAINIALNSSNISPTLFLRNTKDHKVTISSLYSNEEKKFSFDPTDINFQILFDSLICINRSNGCAIINFYTGNTITNILNGKHISSTFRDAENNFWFTTFGKGVYRLNSLECRNMTFYSNAGEQLPVYSIIKKQNAIIAGTRGDYFFSFDKNRPADYNRRRIINGPEISQRIVAVDTLDNGDFFVGTDNEIFKLSPSFTQLKEKFYFYVKSFWKMDDDSFLIATAFHLLLFNPKKFTVLDTLLNERTTAVYCSNDTLYIGTLDGLIIKIKTKIAPLYVTDHVLKNRIAAIKPSHTGALWIATYGGGVAEYRNNKIIGNFTEKDGLTSNICRCLYINGNTVWVGTDKGIGKIDISSKPYRITKITSTDGLASDMINPIFADSTYVFAGTPEGLTFFDEEKLSSNSRCDLRFTDIIAGKDTLHAESKYITLPHNYRDLQFQFVGISYKSAGDITYYYRLNGLNNVWQQTRNTFINYASLLPRKYSFELKAVNKYGIESDTIKINIEVQKAFWQKTGVQIIALTAIALLIFFLIRKRINTIKNREQEKNSVNQRIAELEQLALKSQMNPHFIFNSLNSIQQYVIDKDVEGANEFISNFSRLIRKTLDFSTKKKITVEEEIEYLTTYLSLEKERLKNKFSFSIILEDSIQPSEHYIPPLIMQPFVENAVRHGVRLLKNNNGEITVSIKKENNRLVFAITDNGIGIKAAKEYKSMNAIEYQSKGMNLVADRIEVINKFYPEKIFVEVNDLNKKDKLTGTEAVISFPL